ncbi:MAG: Trk system potassium transporter TrkA [Lachnospiraceae bacterium]|nr:Trk system potassium transporter TrkA [Lachnospiraceae bacterium]
MKIIIAGCGKVGQELAEQLSKEGNEITIIDTRAKIVNELANRYDIMGIVGNGASHLTQAEAGIEKADLFIAVTGSDELNLLCCILAKKAGDCQTIARIRNPEYSREATYIKEELGLAMVINPEYAAAMEMARVLRFPSAIKIDTFAKGRIELLKFRIQEKSVLNNMTVMDISLKLHCDILVCAVERGEEVFIPRGNFVLQEKDVVNIIATPKNASGFFKKIGVVTNQVKDTMIVGGGDIAYYLAENLLQMGIRVKIVDKSRERCERLFELLPKAEVICGDASDQSMLREEGMERTASFVAVTNMDEENILLSMLAKKKTDAKVITKINNIAFNEVMGGLDLDTIICPKIVTAEYIVRFVRAMKNSIGSNVETLYRIIEDKAEALEFVIRKQSDVVDKPLEQLKIKKNIVVACIYRNRKVIIPRGYDSMQVGDSVIIVTTNTGLNDIDDIISR